MTSRRWQADDRPRVRRPAPLFASIAIAMAVLAAACSDDGSSSGSANAGTDDANASTPPACPSGTSEADGLCVADGREAAQVADEVRTVFEDESLGAVIVGVWDGDDPLMVGALGETLTGVPATVDMHHRAGNISNAMLETALLQQIDAGVLDLDDRLSEWYPDLPAADQITIEMLARSTSGYQHYTQLDSFQQAFYEDPFRMWSADELIAFGVAGGPLYPPGTDWNFSDTNFIILGQVLEEATGTPVDELIQDGILDPLDMDDTTPPLNAALPEPVLHSYTQERGPWEEATFWDPTWTMYAGGMGSNQEDLRKFLVALGEGELVSEESHREQLAPANVGLGSNTADRYYAMGLGVVNDWLFANPSLQGYSGALGYLPDRELTIIVYTTRTQSIPDEPYATQIFEGLTTILSPDNEVKLPS